MIKAIQPLGFPWPTQDPFIFCVHHLDHYPSGTKDFSVSPELLTNRQLGADFNPNQPWRMYHGQNIPGFPYHPHVGFETVTIGQQGYIDHSDSLGAAGRFGARDVQWMTAGSGVQHSEMFPLINQDAPNTLELFQIWLNLPAKDKMADPCFKMLWGEDIPVIEHTDVKGKKTKIDLIAGSLDTHQAPAPTPQSWAMNPQNEVLILTIQMQEGASWTLPPASKGINRSVFFYEGQNLYLKDQSVSVNHAVHLEPSEALQIQNGEKPSKLLILQAKPINEPVVQQGPFVGNSQAEISEAFARFRQTAFGGWPWPRQEMSHTDRVGRFALHANGELEEPDS